MITGPFLAAASPALPKTMPFGLVIPDLSWTAARSGALPPPGRPGQARRQSATVTMRAASDQLCDARPGLVTGLRHSGCQGWVVPGVARRACVPSW
jgi:hypothetical protein